MEKLTAVTVKQFMIRNIVFFVALAVAVVSCFFVKPDVKYFEYIDYKTITTLFCMLLVICALKNIYFFRILAKNIIRLFKTTRSSIMALVFITYFSSMLIANDMALLTFLPLGLMVLKSTGKEKFMIFTFIMQNIAANLGGMLTPFGNPQNLYLYNYFAIPTGEFFAIMLVPFLVSLVLIFVSCMFVPKQKLELLPEQTVKKLDVKRALIYIIFFIFTLVIVFRVVPFWTGFFVVPFIILLDKKAMLQVDYMLLLTFVLFFIFAGNFARVEAIKAVLSRLTASSALLTGVISCQLISNVPSAVLLANFTTNYPALLRAVNIGGCGTIISSLASLITFKTFCAESRGADDSTKNECSDKQQAKNSNKNKAKYLLYFSIINFAFLGILLLVCWFLP